MGTVAGFWVTIVKATPFLSVDEGQEGGVRMTHATACAFRTTSAMAFCLPDAECQGIFLPDNKCQGIWRPVDTRHSICLPHNECQGISPSRRRVSGYIAFR